MTTNLLVVLGATGHQGGAVISHFLEQSEYKLRGLTRSTEGAKAQELGALGVDMVAADLGDVQSLKEAFKGATHIFANTDSNQFIYDAIKNPSLLKPGQTAVQYGVSKEKEYAQNLVEAAASCQTLERIIWSSLPSPSKRSHGEFTKVAMFDMKDTIAGMFHDNAQLKPKLSILLNAFYLDNAVRVPELYGPKKASDGVFELSFPMSGDAPVPMADITADEGIWVEALMKSPPGTVLVGCTEVSSWSMWLQAWGEHVDVPVRYVQCKPDEFATNMQGMQEAISEEFQYVGKYGFSGPDTGEVTLDDLEWKSAKPLSSIQRHLRRTDWSAILKD